MNETQVKQLAAAVARARQAAGLSIREVAARSGINHANVLRLEQGNVPNPRLETVRAVAKAVELDLNDLLATIGYVEKGALPSFSPYLRSKYKDLPSEARNELDTAFQKIATKYGYDPAGPNPEEDEA